MPQTMETHLSFSRGKAAAQASAYGPPPDIPYTAVPAGSVSKQSQHSHEEYVVRTKTL